MNKKSKRIINLTRKILKTIIVHVKNQKQKLLMNPFCQRDQY